MHIQSRGGTNFIKLIKALCEVRQREREGRLLQNIVSRTKHIGFRYSCNEAQRDAEDTPGHKGAEDA